MKKKNQTNEKYLIGLTGQSGSGKTSVADLLVKHGFYKIDADFVSRKITNSEPCLSALVSHFGDQILNEDRSLSRKSLAKIVFNDKAELNKLNEISHPFIIKEILDMVNNIDNSLIVIDAPTLIESKLSEKCDFIVVVTATLELRLNRIMKRDKISLGKANERVMAQKNEFFYTKKANIVINNIKRGSPNLETKVDHLATYIKNKFIIKMWDFD